MARIDLQEFTAALARLERIRHELPSVWTKGAARTPVMTAEHARSARYFYDRLQGMRFAGIDGTAGGMYTPALPRVPTVQAIRCPECGAPLPKPETCRCGHCGCWSVVG